MLEGLTDMWYLEGLSNLLMAAGKTGISDQIALIPANCASKVVYFATILRAQNLKIAALLDSDADSFIKDLLDAMGNIASSKFEDSCAFGF